MAMINLLPWRAERRREREREFYAMLGAAAVAAILVWLLWGFWMNVRTETQEARNAYLKGEYAKLIEDRVAVIRKRYKLDRNTRVWEPEQMPTKQQLELY